MDITVVGTGYVGLVAGTCFAEMGHRVECVDINGEKINALNSGKCPIFEPGLLPLIKKNRGAGRLSFSTDLKQAVKKSGIIFIAVGTPPRENGGADLSFVENVAREVAEAADSPKIVVEKSTVPVETGEKIKQVLKEYNPHKVKFEVVSNPEFLREGSAVQDFLKPDRIVVGTGSEEARKTMERLYKPLGAEILFTDIKSAEIIKHASNSFLASKISFINAVAELCEKVGADVEKVAEGMGLDKRIGKSFLNAGIGYGGFCFPKDVEAFIHIAEKQGYDFKILREVQNVNTAARKRFVKKVEEAMWVLKGKKIAVLGLAFKPNTDDMRFAPSIEIINDLLKEGATISAYDPEAEENAAEIFEGKITINDTAFQALEGADAVLLLTEWDEFKNFDFAKMKELMRGRFVFDGRNLWKEKQLQSHGFVYKGVGI